MVKQLTHIAVYEKGVEASAVTAVLEESTGIGPEPELKELIIDHPFYFSIDDRLNHKILFLGHIQDIDAEDDPSANILHQIKQSTPTICYDMMGRRQPNLKKGLNIINDGGRKRIIVRIS